MLKSGKASAENRCRQHPELLEEGITIGREEGIQIGKTERILSLIRLVCRKHAKGCTVDETADMLEESADTIRRIYEAAEKYTPAYDIQKIYEELKLSRGSEQMHLIG